MFTKRRISPLSSSRRSRIPAWRFSRSSITWRMDEPSAGTSPSPPVNRRNGVGTRTRTAMINLYLHQADLDAYSGADRQTSGSPAAICAFFWRALGRRGRALAVAKPLEQRIELAQPRVDHERPFDCAGHGFERLVAVAGYRHHRGFVRLDSSLLDQFQRYRQRGSPGGLGKDALGAREQFDRLYYFGVGRTVTPSAGLPHRPQHVVAVGRIANRDRLGDGVRLDRGDQVNALVQRVNDGCGSGRLRGVNFELWPFDQSDFLELFEGLGDLGKASAASGRNHDVVGQLPSELLGYFKAEGPGALGSVGPEIDIDEGPSVLVGNLAAQPIDVVVVTANRDDLRSIDGRADDLSGFHALGHEDEAFEASSRGVRGDSRREVAG